MIFAVLADIFNGILPICRDSCSLFGDSHVELFSRRSPIGFGNLERHGGLKPCVTLLIQPATWPMENARGQGRCTETVFQPILVSRFFSICRPVK